jgi:hypothetical protein
MKINRGLLYTILLNWWYCLLHLPKTDPWMIIILAGTSSYIISSDINGFLCRKNGKDPPEF